MKKEKSEDNNPQQLNKNFKNTEYAAPTEITNPGRPSINPNFQKYVSTNLEMGFAINLITENFFLRSNKSCAPNVE